MHYSKSTVWVLTTVYPHVTTTIITVCNLTFIPEDPRAPLQPTLPPPAPSHHLLLYFLSLRISFVHCRSSRKWSHIVYSLCCTNSFAQNNILRSVHVSAHISSTFLFGLSGVDVLGLFIHSPVDGHLGFFQFGAIPN